jgi:hypothetical protein
MFKRTPIVADPMAGTGRVLTGPMTAPQRRETDMSDRIWGCIDKETEERHLKEWPLEDGKERLYYDHTGRFFYDYDPNAPVDPIEQELWDILQEEILKEQVKELLAPLYYWGA